MKDRGINSLQELVQTGSYKGQPTELFYKSLSKEFRPKFKDEWELKESGCSANGSDVERQEQRQHRAG